MKTHALATFDETVDLVIHLNVDPKHGDQIVRGNCTLPNSLGHFLILDLLRKLWKCWGNLKEIYGKFLGNLLGIL